MKRLFTLAIVAMIASLTFAQAPVQKKAAAKSQIEKVASNAQMQKALEAKVAMAAKAQAAQETSGSVLRKAAPTAFAAKAMQMQAPRTLTTFAAKAAPAKRGMQYKNAAEAVMQTRMNKGLMGRKSFGPAKVQGEIADGDYVLMNVATGTYLNGGNSWGTQASATKHGQFMTLTKMEDGKYSIDSHISNGGNSHYLGTGGFVDAAATGFTITEVAAGVYTIANGETLLATNAENTVVAFTAAEATTEAAQWMLMSKEDILAAMAVAPKGDLVDVTALLADANFGRNNQGYSSWNWEFTTEGTNHANSGDNTNFCVESFHQGFKVSQTLTNMPNGTYVVYAQGFYRQDGTDEENLPVFFANDATVAFKNVTEEATAEADANHTVEKPEGFIPNSMGHASNIFSQGGFVTGPITVEVVDGTLTVGAKNEVNNNLWVIFDNFELYYVGNAEANPYAEVDLTLEASDYSAEYYDDTQDWYCVLQTQAGPFRFDILTSEALNGTYTWDQMDPDYSWAGTNSMGWSYTDAIFTVNAEGTEVVAYATLEDGTKVCITYTKPEAPEITAYQTYEFSVAETSLVDYTADMGLFQIVGDNGDQYVGVAINSNQIAGTYTIDDMYGAYTNLYVSADDYTGVKPFALNATVTEDGATVIYDGYNGTEYTLIFHFQEEGGNDDDDEEVVVTKDDNGIITSVTGGEARAYTRGGDGLYYTSSGISSQNGTVNVVVDGNDFYIKNPIAGATYNAWVKGTLSEDGKTLTIPTSQPLAFNASYNAFIELTYGDFTGSTFTRNTTNDITFTVNGNTLTLNGADAEIVGTSVNFTTTLGDFWSDDDTWQGHGEWNSVLTYDPEYVAPSTDLVELPDGAQVEAWNMSGASVTSSSTTPFQNQAVNVAFVGDDVYVQGIFEDFPESWVKGTKSGSTVTFSKLQYLGSYAGAYDIYFIGTDGQEMTDATATLSADAQTLTFNTDILANAATDRIYYLTWLENVVISATPAEEPVITDLTAALPYVNTFETDAEQAEAAIYDANGDGKTWAMTTDTSKGDKAVRYTYHSSNSGDDYVVFPGFTMEAGKSYKVSVDARSNSSYYPERIEIVAGTVAKASELTTVVLPATDLTTGDYETLIATFEPEADGVYYIALHSVSDPDNFYLYADNFSVKENNMNAPEAPANFVVTPAEDASLSATIEFNAPVKNLAGEDIEENVKMNVMRDGEVIFGNVTVPAGELVQLMDNNVPAPGTYVYSVTATVGDLTSDAVKATVYVGEDTPDDVENLEIVDLNGKVGMTWDAPVDGVNGGMIIAENLKYNVYPVEMVEFFGFEFPSIDFENPYVTGLTATEATVDFDTNAGDQAYTYFGVTAENTAGESMGAMGAVLTGAPYELPVVETLEGGNLSYWWGVDMDDNNYSLSQTDDVGLFLGEENDFLFITGVQGWVKLESGKIALNGAESAALVFDAKGAANFDVKVYGPAGEAITAQVAGTENYATQTVQISGLKDQPWVRFEIKADFQNAGEASVKNIIVMDQVENDLEIAVSAPATVVAGQTATVKATVTNKGTAEASAYTVKFTVNDEEVQTVSEVTSLNFFESAEYTYSLETSIFAEAGDLTVKAEVVYAADAIEANNADEVVVAVAAPTATPVESVVAENVEGGVKIDWTVAESVASEVTEDFESYDADVVYADGTACGPWAAVDLSQGSTYSFNSGAWDHMGESYAFGILDFVNEGLDEGSFSGTKAAVFMSEVNAVSQNGQAADKYMISPELPGVAQTISLMAKVITAQYGDETFEVMASSTDANPASFTKVANFATSATDWTEFSAQLPEGTKYFAIHYTSNDIFGLYVDDVKYTAGGGTPSGFNVYVDEVQVASVDADARTYTATNVPAGNHKFSVTAVYGNNESAPVSATLATAINSVAGTQAATEAYTISGIRMDAKNLKRGVYVVNGKKVVK